MNWKKYANYYVDDWGEQYVGKNQAVISILSLDSMEISILDNLPEDYTPGQVSLVFNIKIKNY